MVNEKQLLDKWFSNNAALSKEEYNTIKQLASEQQQPLKTIAVKSLTATEKDILLILQASNGLSAHGVFQRTETNLRLSTVQTYLSKLVRAGHVVKSTTSRPRIYFKKLV